MPQHLNAPEARMYLSRQLYEEALHVQFYLTLLDTYVPDPEERHRAFAAVENIPSIRRKAEFCMRWLDSIQACSRLDTAAQRRQFLLNLICFAACIEGLFFFGAFAYVYFLRSRGLLHGLAAGTSWVFRDESAHMAFAFEVVRTIRREEPALFDDEMEQAVRDMLDEAVACETQFAEDLLGAGWLAFRSRSCANISSSAPISGWRLSASGGAMAPRTRCRSWTFRTCRRSRTSSSGACRPIRSG
jgi:ribonucleoside-diphosphate reductase beta chain